MPNTLLEGARLTRDEVRKVVDGEAKFSEKWDRERPPGSQADKDTPVEVWLYWMEAYLAEAKRAATTAFDKRTALQNLRCILNLGETCAMYHGLPEREAGDSTDLYTK